MEVRQLEYLVAVAEEGGFTKAAERLLAAQPSLSQQIKKLEKEVGQPLFDRLPRGVALTEAGQRLLEHARRVLRELTDARQRVREVGDRVTGSLTVGAIPTIAPFLLPRAVRAFRRRWPEVKLSLAEDVTSRLLEAVGRGELDLAVVSTAPDAGTVHVERIGSEPLYLLVPAVHPLARRKKVRWSDLADEPFLVLHDMHCLTGQVLQSCQPHGVKLAVAARGAQLATLAAMVSAGLGVTMVPAVFRAADQAPDRVCVAFAEPVPRRDLCLAWSVLRYRTNAARAFGAIVRATVTAARDR
jgi:LysR family transcriptional regulator, hydrogen peroxide-inducible genes activator